MLVACSLQPQCQITGFFFCTAVQRLSNIQHPVLAGLRHWRSCAARRHSHRTRLGAALATQATHLLSAALAHWQLFAAQQRGRAAAAALAATWASRPVLVRALAAWQRVHAAVAERRTRRLDLTWRLRTAAAATGAAAAARPSPLRQFVPTCPATAGRDRSHGARLASAAAEQRAGERRAQHMCALLAHAKRAGAVTQARRALLTAAAAAASAATQPGRRFRATATCVHWAANIRRFVPEAACSPLLFTTTSSSWCEYCASPNAQIAI